MQAILGKKPDAAFLRSLDTDGSGDVTEMEYLSALLVRLQFVEQEQIDLIMKSFMKLDVDGSGTLTIEDLVQDMDNQKDDEYDDEEDDENEESKVQKVAPGGRYSFTGPIGGLLVSAAKGQDDTSVSPPPPPPAPPPAAAAAAALTTKEEEEKKTADDDDDVVNQAEALLEEATTPNTDADADAANAVNAEAATITTTTSTTDDAAVERDVLEEATEVLQTLGVSSEGEENPAAPIQAVADDADENGQVLGQCIAMYDYVSDGQHGELSFKAGDVIDVTELDNSDGWWHGCLNGTWGSFPFGFVYCHLEKNGIKYLMLPRDWAVHESTGKKVKLGTFSYEEKTLTDDNGVVQDWSDAKLL